VKAKPLQLERVKDLPDDIAAPSVTVVMPVRNEETFIARTLDQLLDQQRAGIELEIVVVDGRSTDKTREIISTYAEHHPEVRLLDNPRQLSSAARNLGIENSTGDFIVIVDGHCEIPSRRYLLDLVAAFEASEADCLGRPQPLDVTQATMLQRAIALARSSRLGHHPDSLIYSDREMDCPAASVAVAYRRSVFEQVGLFDERFDACEDYELNQRIDAAGLRCRLIPKLTVKYEPRKTLWALFRQLFRYGRGRVRLARKHRRALSWRTVAPAVLVIGTFAGPLLSAILPVIWPCYGVALSFYVGVTVLESVRLSASAKDLRLLPWLPPVFCGIHFGSGCGLLWEMARPHRGQQP